MIYVWAYLFSTVGSWMLLSALVPIVHRTSGIKGTNKNQQGDKRPFFRPLDLWVGFTERAIATTLVIWAPKLLPLFAGGWITAKLAAGWSYTAGEERYAAARVVSLIGSTLSFALAIAAGIWADPASIQDFGKLGD